MLKSASSLSKKAAKKYRDDIIYDFRFWVRDRSELWMIHAWLLERVPSSRGHVTMGSQSVPWFGHSLFMEYFFPSK